MHTAERQMWSVREGKNQRRKESDKPFKVKEEMKRPSENRQTNRQVENTEDLSSVQAKNVEKVRGVCLCGQ